MAGQVTASVVQLGDSGTATQNFVVRVPAAPDGTMRIARGNAGAESADIMTVDSSGNVTFVGQLTLSAQPAFLAFLNASAANVTGDATYYVPAFGTEVFDVGGNYNNSTYTFTAPKTGIYQFNATVFLTDIGAGHNNFDLRLVTSNRTYHGLGNATPANVFQNLVLTINTLADMDANDTAYIDVAAIGGAKTVDVLGNASQLYTSFSAYRVA